MPPKVERTALWLAGPMLAIALVAFAVIGHGGPGFFFLSVAAGAALMLGAPILQFALLRTAKYKGRQGAACAVALVLIVAGMSIPVFLGVFNFF
jgi:hypothetical protein